MKLTEEQFREIYERTQGAIQRAAAERAKHFASAPVPQPAVGNHDDKASGIPCPVVEPSPRRRAPRKASNEAGGSDFFRIRIETARVRLLDPDNAYVKQLVDCLRYAGIIPQDTPDRVEVQVSQRKVAAAEEGTTITITKISGGTPSGK